MAEFLREMEKNNDLICSRKKLKHTKTVPF